MALLIQNEAALLSPVAEIDRTSSERFARIEADLNAILRVLGEHTRVLGEHTHILAEHSQILQHLPEAIREKMGFKSAQ